MPHLSFFLSAYRFVTHVLSPVAPFLLKRRLLRGKESLVRWPERLGYATLPRPEGRLIWIHGASVGECLASLPLIALLTERGAWSVLVTSGTVTSAEVMAKRLPSEARHQFLPVDIPAAVSRFFEHWHPDVGLFIDSDIWPNLILDAKARHIPVAIINARMSERSFARWRRVHASALFSQLTAVLAQNQDEAERFGALGVADVRIVGSLKADAPPLSVDVEALMALQTQIGARPVFLAAQTHAGEEETLLPAADLLASRFPDLLTVIVPRHPERGVRIAALCGDRSVALRSRGDVIRPETSVYIADTIGEMGLFYRLSRFSFLGGSLIAHGGQNPLEPAKLERAVLAGPHTFNFTDAYAAIWAAQGMGNVATAAEIARMAETLLRDPTRAAYLGAQAARAAVSLRGASVKTVDFVWGLLNHADA